MYIGGTNVSGALIIPPEEKRPVVSLDLSEMDQILWIDEENLTAHIQAGIIGQDLERKVGVVTKTLSTPALGGEKYNLVELPNRGH